MPTAPDVFEEAKYAKALLGKCSDELLAQLMESKQEPLEKLEQYSKVATDYPSVAALLKSLHVKDPRGEFLSQNPQAETCVKCMRVARNGIKAVAKEIFRNCVPASADTAPLIDAVMSGMLVGTGACSVSSLADLSKGKTWLGCRLRQLTRQARQASVVTFSSFN